MTSAGRVENEPMGFFDLFRRAEHVAGLDQLMEFLDAQAAIAVLRRRL